jgi:recombination DNA repair RAD52 pathway protein
MMFSSEDRGLFSAAQVNQLLKPINPSRVLQAQGHSHVSQQDITAHLIRMFGFGNFDIEVVNTELIFETERTDPKTGELNGRWDVAYKSIVRLTIRNPLGVHVTTLENGSVEEALNQARGAAHALAYKSAISVSIKRAAIALGDQFGLSLYNKGQLKELVKLTLVGTEEVPEDVQAGIPQQVALGNDEIERDA